MGPFTDMGLPPSDDQLFIYNLIKDQDLFDEPLGRTFHGTYDHLFDTSIDRTISSRSINKTYREWYGSTPTEEWARIMPSNVTSALLRKADFLSIFPTSMLNERGMRFRDLAFYPAYEKLKQIVIPSTFEGLLLTIRLKFLYRSISYSAHPGFKPLDVDEMMFLMVERQSALEIKVGASVATEEEYNFIAKMMRKPELINENISVHRKMGGGKLPSNPIYARHLNENFAWY